MRKKVNVDKIRGELDALDSVTRFELVNDLLKSLKADVEQSAKRKTRKLSELKGLGKEIWKGIDVEAYIRGERDSWR